MIQAETSSIRKAVENLLGQGFFEPTPNPDLRVGEPLVVVDGEGRQHSWFVPLIFGTKLAGFAEMLPSGALLRFSSFQSGRQDCAACPDLADWVDRERVLARAATVAAKGERLSDAVLSYDQLPSRLAWRVTAKAPSGATRLLFVTGTVAYAGAAPRGWG